MWQCWLALHALLVVCSVQHWLTYTNLWSPIIHICVYITYQWQHVVGWHLMLSLELRVLLNVNHQSESVRCRTFVSVWSVHAYTDTTGKLWGAATLIPAAHSNVQLCFQDSSQHSHLRHSVYTLPWLPLGSTVYCYWCNCCMCWTFVRCCQSCSVSLATVMSTAVCILLCSNS